MKRLQFPDHESLSRAAAEQILQLVCANPQASICLATGSTPTRTYELLQDLAQSPESTMIARATPQEARHELAQAPDSAGVTPASIFRQATIVKLDEWGGLDDLHPATCEAYLRQYIIDPLQINQQRYISFRASAADPLAECERVKNQLSSKVRQLDLCVLGLGINGHLGFNEPANVLTAHTHIAKLSEQTQQHPMVRANENKPSYGFTLGIADLLQAKTIILLVSGEHKRSQMARLMEESVDTNFPASFLWLHPEVTIYSDLAF